MTRKQWIIIVTAIVVMVALTFGIVQLTKKQDREEDVVEDIKEEQKETKEEIDSEIEDILGIPEKILTRNEMEKIIEKWQEEDPDLRGGRLEDKIEEEFGEINRVAYWHGYLAEDTDSEYDRIQMLHQLLVMYRNKDLNILGAKSLIEYRNPVGGGEYMKEATRVIDPYGETSGKGYLFVTDTKGFTEIDGVYVGYPRITNSSLYPHTLDTIDRIELPMVLGFEVDVLLKETIKVKEAIRKYTELPIAVNGEKVLPPYGSMDKETYEDYMRESVQMTEEEIKEDYEVLTKLKGLEGRVTAGIRTSDNYLEDINKQLSKSILKDGILTVSYEVPTEAVIEGYVFGTKYLDYLNDDSTVTVTIGDEEFNLEFLTDELQQIGIYYRE